MVLKIEDCTIILKSIHNVIDLIFIFDHSYGNDRGIEDKFDATKMNSGYRGA